MPGSYNPNFINSIIWFDQLSLLDKYKLVDVSKVNESVIYSDKGMTLKISALETLDGCQSTLSRELSGKKPTPPPPNPTPPTNPAPQFLSNFNLQFKIVNLQFEIISVGNSVKDTALMSILVVFFVV